MNIHFPGMKGIDIPSVWLFPKVFVCMDCGAAQFLVPEAEKKQLADNDYRLLPDEAAV